MNAIIPQTVSSSRFFIETDRSQAERYLTLLDESAESFTFQTFDDNKLRHKKNMEELGCDQYVKTLNGSLTIEPDRHQAESFLNLLDESATSWTFQTFTDCRHTITNNFQPTVIYSF